jgi:glycosyltransferase involved in cell wall biosynthesis
MPKKLIFAKKLRLPSTRANVLQSLNMALAFSSTGHTVRCFPGCSPAPAENSPPGGSRGDRRRATLLAALQGLGKDAIPDGWRILPSSHKGLYGALFRLALLRERSHHGNAAYYARDTSEALFLSAVNHFVPLSLIFEAHEVLHLLQKNSGSSHWEQTLGKEKSIFANISGLVLINEGILDDVRSIFGYNGPVLIAENGYNPALFHSLPLLDEENPWPGEEDRVKLVYVGNFMHGKGVRVLLEALARLPDRFQLRLVGGHPRDKMLLLRAWARDLNLGRRVEFFGAVPQHEVAEACKGAHIFVVPQQSNFFFSPLKLYEAIAMGLPAIVTPLAIFKPYIDAKVVLGAPDSSPAGLASAIAQLAARPKLAHLLRERALGEAVEHTWDKRAQKIADFIDDLPPPK